MFSSVDSQVFDLRNGQYVTSWGQGASLQMEKVELEMDIKDLT